MSLFECVKIWKACHRSHLLRMSQQVDTFSVNVLCCSFVTPPPRVDVDESARSAQRSLDFGRSRLNSDPVPMTSDPHRLSNHSCPDVSSYLEVSPSWRPRCTRASVDRAVYPSRQSAGSTTVKALLTPIARRLQSSSSVTPPCRSCPANNCYPDHLDRTLTDAGNSLEQHNPVASEAGEAAVCHAADESSHSRWSASDYFHRYPNARLDSTDNTVRDGTPYSESKLQHLTDARSRLQPAVNGDVDASTLISSIHQNRSPAQQCQSPTSAPSVGGSVETSSSLDSISTNDDAAFRAGLAQLDANIALVQQRLRGSLSNLTSACRSPHAKSDHHT